MPMSERTIPLLAARGLWKARGSRWAVQDVSFELHRGRVVHLRGANGAGKSTLLRMLTGELPPSDGTVEVDGIPMGSGPDEGRHRLALVPEVLLPSPWLTVHEYLAFRADLRGGETPDRTLDDWELTPFAQRPMDTLSQGERRRIVVAAAMAARPDVLLLDEPTVGMDTHHCERLVERLRVFAADRAVLVSSHIERHGLPAFDDTLTLVEGRLEQPCA